MRDLMFLWLQATETNVIKDYDAEGGEDGGRGGRGRGEGLGKGELKNQTQ